MADVQLKRKVGISPHAGFSTYSSAPSSPTKSSRPPSPLKRTQAQPIAEQSRPRAKVSGGATVVVGKKPPSTLNTVYTSGSTTPRASSPSNTRQQNSQQSRLLQGIGTRTLSRVRSRGALSVVSAPSSPRVANVRAEYSSLSAATSDSDLVKPIPPRSRRPSISSASQISTHTAVTNGVSSPLSSVEFSQDPGAQSNVSAHRIKAKVTSLAKGKSPAPGQTPPSPLLMPSPSLNRAASHAPLSPTSHVRHHLGRTASIDAFSAPATPPEIYPITTASPAANVHRYATFRSPSYTYRPPHPFSSPLQTEHKPPQSDPSLVPLPPLSPPVSSISFSSRSSVSRSSFNSTNHTLVPGVHPDGHERFSDPASFHPVNGPNVRRKSRPNSLVIHDTDACQFRRADSSEPDIDESSEERTMKAEAKSHRKIADLEITTKSLLAINSQLEANKHKQAKEIRDLRRKLRESQLALPPRTYRELKATGEAVDIDKDDEEPEEQEFDGDEEAKWKAEAIRLGKDDGLFDRVRLVLENLLTTGKQALALKVEDLAPPKGAAKVLHEVEARSWREGGSRRVSGAVTGAESNHVDDSTLDDCSSSSSDYGAGAHSCMVGDSSQDYNDSTRSEREVEELIGNSLSSSSARLR